MDKKRNTDELYARAQWSDNMAFSKKAMHESKKKQTGALPPVPTSNSTQPLNPQMAQQRPPQQGQGQLGQYVNEMNQEINRVSDAVGDKLDQMGNKISHSVQGKVAPLGEGLNTLFDSFLHSLHAMTIGVLQAVLHEVTIVLRNLSSQILGTAPPEQSTPAATTGTRRQATSPLVTAPLQQPTAKLPKETPQDIPAFKVHFGHLLEKKIFFSTIHSHPFLTEQDIHKYQAQDKTLAYEWMKRGLEEIRNCAPYGQKLPTPQKGPFMGIPMHDVLGNLSFQDLELFLNFVNNRPHPFQQKSLKLSEAFATWVHKGAPSK